MTGTAGNDTYTATVNDTTNATDATWTSLDSLDGGAGTDVLNLNILTANSNATSMLNIAKGTLANIETINIQAVESIDGSATDDATAVDFSNVSGLTTLNTTKSTTAVLKAAATTDVNVSGATGAVTVDGGKNVSVTDATANTNITVGDTTESAGTVTVTDTKQGTGNIVVEGGTDVTVTATTTVTTAPVAAGTINVGNNTDAPTGAIKVTQNNVSNGSDANSSATTVAEQQTVVVTGAATGAVTFLGHAVALSANADTAEQTIDKIISDAANVINTWNTANAGKEIDTIDKASATTLTITYKNTEGDVAEITAATSAGITFADSVEIVKGAIAGATDEDLTAGAINVKGGTSIDITVNSTNTATAVEGDGDIINGTVTATAGDATTSMSVVQNNVATTFTKAAVATVNEKSTVTFGAMKSGETLTVNNLSFKASKDLIAEQVASAFANLIAGDKQSAGGSTANGIYTGTFNTAVWTSAAASGATVVFTAQDEDETDLAFTGTAATNDAGARIPTQAKTTGTAAVAADTTNNTVTAGNVVLNDNATASVTDITVENFGTASLGITNGFDKLANLTLTNNTGAISLDTDSTVLTINANDVVSTITIDAGTATVTDLTINATGKASDTDLTAAKVANLTVKGDQSATLTGSTLTALKTVTVSGTAGLIIGGTNEADTITSVNTSATIGAVTVGIDGSKATYTGGAGVDTVTLATNVALTKAIDLGDGNDTVIFDVAVTGSTATLSGGDGTDTLSMKTANAVALAGTTQSFYTSFERLTINDAVAAADINLENLGFTNYVTTTGSLGTLTLSNLASNGTVVLTAAQTGTTIKVKDADTGTADIVNVIAQVSTADINFNALTIANVETINLTATDTNVDEDNDGITYETGDRDKATVALTADKATTVNVTGNANFELTMTAANVTKVDATSLEGVLTYDTDNANMTVIGGNGADAITASVNGVTINGGAGNDTITIGTNGSTNIDSVKLDGGAGADTFKFLDVATTDSLYTVISNIGTGDVIDLTNLSTTAVTTFNNQKITLAQGATESTQSYQDAAMASLADKGAGWFQFGGNTFIVADMDDDATYTDGVDFTVMLVGNVDLSTASFNTAGLIEIA